jgi:hypothetical protein
MRSLTGREHHLSALQMQCPRAQGHTYSLSCGDRIRLPQQPSIAWESP